jgi:hypothetical protein
MYRYLQESTEEPHCKTAAECKGTVGIVMDVIVGIKMVVLLFGNLQGWLWWRSVKSNTFTTSLKLLLLASSGIVSF